MQFFGDTSRTSARTIADAAPDRDAAPLFDAEPDRNAEPDCDAEPNANVSGCSAVLAQTLQPTRGAAAG